MEIGSKDPWQQEIMNYLQNSSNKVEFKTKQKALKYTMIGDELYIMSFNGVVLQCVTKLNQCDSWEKILV